MSREDGLERQRWGAQAGRQIIQISSGLVRIWDFIPCSRQELDLFAAAGIAADGVAYATMTAAQPWRHRMPLSSVLPEVSFLGL